MPSKIIPISKLAPRDRNSLTNSCMGCSPGRHCCTRANTIVVLPSERLDLLDRTGRLDAFVPLTPNLYRLNKTGGAPCPFLARNRSCSVYENRPTDCRIWPVGFIRSDDGSLSARLDAACTAVQSDAVSTAFIETARNALQRFSLVQLEEYLSIMVEEYDYYPMRETVAEEPETNTSIYQTLAYNGA